MNRRPGLGHYALDKDHNVVEVDLWEWAFQFEMVQDRQVASTKVSGIWGSQWISTVFLGLDHNFAGEGRPIVFETMIFGGPLSERYQRRYCTWDEAVEGHAEAVRVAERQQRNFRGWTRYYLKEAQQAWWEHNAFLNEAIKPQYDEHSPATSEQEMALQFNSMLARRSSIDRGHE
jgi:hypothetical protein